MKWPNDRERESTMDKVRGRQQIIESAVQSLCSGFTPALFIWGPPGLGKSHILTSVLSGLCGSDWKHHTAYSTPKGLMLAIAEAPACIHLFEDCEKMLKTDLSASLLRAACGSPNGGPRWVTYETAHETLRVNFTGGVIIASNENLSRKNGPMQGVASRFRPMKWELTMEERVAVIATICRYPRQIGKITVSPADAKKVALTLIGMLQDADTADTLDLRLFAEHALPAFAHSVSTGVDNWQDMLAAKLSGACEKKEEGQSRRTERLRNLAQLIAAGPGKAADKVEEWKTKTGLGQAIYYRHLKASKRA